MGGREKGKGERVGRGGMGAERGEWEGHNADANEGRGGGGREVKKLGDGLFVGVIFVVGMFTINLWPHSCAAVASPAQSLRPSCSPTATLTAASAAPPFPHFLPLCPSPAAPLALGVHRRQVMGSGEGFRGRNNPGMTEKEKPRRQGEVVGAGDLGRGESV